MFNMTGGFLKRPPLYKPQTQPHQNTILKLQSKYKYTPKPAKKKLQIKTKNIKKGGSIYRKPIASDRSRENKGQKDAFSPRGSDPEYDLQAEAKVVAGGLLDWKKSGAGTVWDGVSGGVRGVLADF